MGFVKKSKEKKEKVDEIDNKIKQETNNCVPLERITSPSQLKDFRYVAPSEVENFFIVWSTEEMDKRSFGFWFVFMRNVVDPNPKKVVVKQWDPTITPKENMTSESYFLCPKAGPSEPINIIPYYIIDKNMNDTTVTPEHALSEKLTHGDIGNYWDVEHLSKEDTQNADIIFIKAKQKGITNDDDEIVHEGAAKLIVKSWKDVKEHHMSAEDDDSIEIDKAMSVLLNKYEYLMVKFEGNVLN